MTYITQNIGSFHGSDHEGGETVRVTQLDVCMLYVSETVDQGQLAQSWQKTKYRYNSK